MRSADGLEDGLNWRGCLVDSVMAENYITPIRGLFLPPLEALGRTVLASWPGPALGQILLSDRSIPARFASAPCRRVIASAGNARARSPPADEMAL
jgi:hypothetical protein